MKENVKAPVKFAAAVTVVLAVVLGPMMAEAQRAAVRGRVFDEEGNALEGVLISVQCLGRSRPKTTKSKSNGSFSVVGLPIDRCTIEYTMEGYQLAMTQVRTSSTPNDLDDMRLFKVPEGFITEEMSKEANELLQQGTEAMNAKDWDGALEAMHKFLEIVPGSPEAHYNIASVYQSMGDTDKALAGFQEVVEMRPDMAPAYVAIGDIHGASKQWGEGIAAYSKALALNPNQVAVQFNQAIYAMNSGDLDMAGQSFLNVIGLKEDYAPAHFQLGMVRVGQQRNEEAVEHFEKYLELQPDGSSADTAKGMLESLKSQQ